MRGELGESGQYGRLLPHRFCQRAVDGDVSLDAGDADVELVVAAAVDDGGSGGEDEAGLHGSKMAAVPDGVKPFYMLFAIGISCLT